MMKRNPVDLYRSALEVADRSSGYYNLNIRVNDDGRPVLVRIPIEGAHEMDLRVWDEQAVLQAIDPYVHDAPRVLFTSVSPKFQVQEFIEGDVVDDIAPRGVPVPAPVVSGALRLFRELQQVPLGALPSLPPHWPEDGATQQFARKLSSVTAGVFRRFRDAYAWSMRECRIPPEPLSAVEEGWDMLSARPFCLVHADVHRKNILLAGERAVFLDWELALWGDPVYELAVHLHKVAYLPGEESSIVTQWAAMMPSDVTSSWRQDVSRYLAHERVKSALVDIVRYVNQFHEGGMSAGTRDAILDRYTNVLAMAYAVWDLSDPRPDRERVTWVLAEGGRHVRR